MRHDVTMPPQPRANMGDDTSLLPNMRGQIWSIFPSPRSVAWVTTALDSAAS